MNDEIIIFDNIIDIEYQEKIKNCSGLWQRIRRSTRTRNFKKILLRANRVILRSRW